MAWMSHYLLWITLVFTSAYETKFTVLPFEIKATLTDIFKNRRGVFENKRHTTNPSLSGEIVFPGPTSGGFLPEVPEECQRTGICDDVPNYPEERVEEIVRKLGDARNKFKIDEFEPEIAQRFGPLDNYIDLCTSRVELIMPRAALDRNNKWHFIINPKDRPLQGFRVEICHGKDSRCSADIAYFNSGYEGVCHQKYVERFMTGLDSNGNVVERPFKVPSCCTCVARTVKEL